MAQNGEDMSATDQSDAAPSVLADNADETQAEIATIPVSDTMTMLASANENAEAAQDNVQMNAPSSTVTADAPVEEATAATEDTSKTPSDGNDEVGQPASFSDAAPQALLAPSEDMPSVAAGSAVTMVTDENKADSLDSDQPQTPAIPVHSAGQDELSMSNNMPDKTSEMSPSQGNDAEHAQNNAVHMVTNDGEIPAASEQAADQPQQSANGNTETVLTEQTMEAKAHQPDSDIEEGEELGSPPPAQTQQETIPRHRSKSPSAGAISRRREGRSRSPERERRPSPQRGQPKASVNREELFKVYIGGLPEKTELQDLEDCFGQFGEIGHIELKLGYAFIEFVTQEGAAEAIETYNEGHFLGKMIKVEASKSATTQQESIDKGTCFTCGEHGHFAKHCPQDPRNANRRRAPIRDRSPPPFGRDRRDFRDRDRDRDRHFNSRDRDRDLPRRDFDRDDSRRFPHRDDRREPDRRRERDYDRERGPRDLDRSRGAGGRYNEAHTRDSHRGGNDSAARERELLDQQRDRERQLRRLAEMDPNFVPPPPISAGYPPRGAPTDPRMFPPGPPPPHAGSPYYPPYGSVSVPPSYAPPPRGLPSTGPYGVSPGNMGPSASPPLPQYPPRGDGHIPYGAPVPYPGNGPADAYYRPNSRLDAREDPNGGFNNNGEPPFDRRERFDDTNGPYSARNPVYPPRDAPPFPPRGSERPQTDPSMPPSVPPYYYDRPPAGWNGAPVERQGAGSPPLDPYARAPPAYPPAGSAAQDYSMYRAGNGDHHGYEAHRERR